MPLIEVTQVQRVTANVRFDAAIVTQINQYAAFIKATPDEVINKGLEYLFAKDRDFAAFRNSEESQRVPELLSPRKAAPPNGAKSLPKKTAAVPEPAASVAGLKA